VRVDVLNRVQAGQSALHIAARVGDAECVRCLLLNGADTDLLNKVCVTSNRTTRRTTPLPLKQVVTVMVATARIVAASPPPRRDACYYIGCVWQTRRLDASNEQGCQIRMLSSADLSSCPQGDFGRFQSSEQHADGCA